MKPPSKPTLIKSRLYRRWKVWFNLYKCSCGNEFISAGSRISRGIVKSCGCFRSKAAAERKSNFRHGQSYTKWYISWNSMCGNCKHHKVLIDPRWIKNPMIFLKDMGEKPEGSSLRRIDTNKGFYKENCVWMKGLKWAKLHQS